MESRNAMPEGLSRPDPAAHPHFSETALVRWQIPVLRSPNLLQACLNRQPTSIFLAFFPLAGAPPASPENPSIRIAGKPLIQHVWERCRQCSRLDEILVATDDERIRAAVTAFGGTAVMTSPDHPTGTDRIAEAVRAAARRHPHRQHPGRRTAHRSRPHRRTRRPWPPIPRSTWPPPPTRSIRRSRRQRPERGQGRHHPRRPRALFLPLAAAVFPQRGRGPARPPPQGHLRLQP
jgi:hypothetical protein